MARSKKSTKDTVKAEIVEEAIVVDAESTVQSEVDESEAQAPDLDESVSSDVADNDEEPALEPETIVNAPTEDHAEDTSETNSVIDKGEVDTESVTQASPQVIVKKRGLASMLMGGVICVGLGYAGANFVKPEGWPFPGTNTNVLQDRLSALEAQLIETKSQTTQVSELVETARTEIASATASVDAKIADLDLSGAIAQIEAVLAAVDQRLTAVEAAPVAEAIVSQEATAAYERQLNEMQTLLNDEVARLQGVKEAAENEEAHAAKASAISRLQEAITTGQPYDAVLKSLDIDVPAALSASAEQGIATLQDIAVSFGESADVAIVETAKIDTESQGWMDRFLRTQLGLRSLSPKDGTSPDAILSRAEQAIRDNDLQTALTEISTLPDVGQAVMADWIASAQIRLDVTNALSAMLAQ